MVRILETKHEMFGLELLEFHYFDDILQDLKLTPVSFMRFVVVAFIYWLLDNFTVFVLFEMCFQV